MNLEKGYDPRFPYNNVTGLKQVVDALIDGRLSDLGSGIYREIHSLLMERGDQYFVLEDFEDYRRKQREINRDYKDKISWAKKMLKILLMQVNFLLIEQFLNMQMKFGI